MTGMNMGINPFMQFFNQSGLHPNWSAGLSGVFFILNSPISSTKFLLLSLPFPSLKFLFIFCLYHSKKFHFIIITILLLFYSFVVFGFYTKFDLIEYFLISNPFMIYKLCVDCNDVLEPNRERFTTNVDECCRSETGHAAYHS